MPEYIWYTADNGTDHLSYVLGVTIKIWLVRASNDLSFVGRLYYGRELIASLSSGEVSALKEEGARLAELFAKCGYDTEEFSREKRKSCT